jgi:hypothetical protein
LKSDTDSYPPVIASQGSVHPSTVQYY